MTADPQIKDNAAWTAAHPVLSVLIPFLRDDPSSLLGQLEIEGEALAGQAELVVLDDGTCDPDLTRRLVGRIEEMRLPVRLITLSANEGRAGGRNRLAKAARGGSLLFLDSDMWPDHPDFLSTWVELATRERPAVAFGGFSLVHAPDEPRFAVHRSLAAKSECVPCAERRKQPEKYVYTSNLLVRRDVFDAETFDSGFSGWGWEDVEWAMRVSRRFEVVHVDNPATHMGLDTVVGLASKYEQSAPNFGRMASRHPEIVSSYPSYRAARLLRRLPARRELRSLLRAAAGAVWLPVPARAFSLRLYRAALYAETV